MNIPDDAAIRIVDWIWTGLLAGMAAVWHFLNKRIDKVAEDAKAHTDDAIKSLDEEVTRQRDIAAKIFDKLEDMRTESAERHERLLVAIHTGLAGKADKK